MHNLPMLMYDSCKGKTILPTRCEIRNIHIRIPKTYSKEIRYKLNEKINDNFTSKSLQQTNKCKQKTNTHPCVFD